MDVVAVVFVLVVVVNEITSKEFCTINADQIKCLKSLTFVTIANL